MQPPLELFLDASAFKESGCNQKLWYIISEGLTAKEISPSLTYGTAFHKFVAVLRTTQKVDEAIKESINYYEPIASKHSTKEWRTLNHLIKTCMGYYANVYNGDLFLPVMSSDTGLTLIEQKFAFKYYEDDKVIIWLSGTIDEIGIFNHSGEYAICDRKTSSSFNIKETLSVYSLSAQLMFYKFVVESATKLKNVGAFIDGIFISATASAKFERSVIFHYTDEQMQSLERGIENVVKDIVLAIHSGNWLMNYSWCNRELYANDKLGVCKFFGLCSYKTSSPELYSSILARDFTTRKYNPLTFDSDIVKD